MNHKLAFAVILQRSFDSAPLSGARFYFGDTLLSPVEKPNGLYVFSDMPVCPVRAEASGMLTETLEPKPGQCLPVCLYGGRGFAAPYGYRIAEFSADPHERLYAAPDGGEMRVIESKAGMARLAARRAAPVGGWLMFKSKDGREEAAFILEKKPPDKYLLMGHGGGFGDGSASRIYVGRADENGVCRIALPQDLTDIAIRKLDYSNGKK